MSKNKRKLQKENYLIKGFDILTRKYGLGGALGELGITSDFVRRKILEVNGKEAEERFSKIELNKEEKKLVEDLKKWIKEEGIDKAKIAYQEGVKGGAYRDPFVDERPAGFFEKFLYYIAKLPKEKQKKVVIELYETFCDLFRTYGETGVSCCFRHYPDEYKDFEKLKYRFLLDKTELNMEINKENIDKIKGEPEVLERIRDGLYSHPKLFLDLPDSLAFSIIDKFFWPRKASIANLYLDAPDELAKKLEKKYKQLKEVVKDYVKERVEEKILEGKEYIRRADEKVRKFMETLRPRDFFPGPFSWSGRFVDTGWWDGEPTAELLLKAARKGIFLENWEDMIDKLKEPYFHASAHPEARWLYEGPADIEEYRKEIRELEEKYKKKKIE